MEIWLSQQPSKVARTCGYADIDESPSERLSMQTVYLLCLKKTCTSAQRAMLKEVLQATPEATLADVQRWVLPRPGLRSAWSSKVQSLLAACGCDGASRVEQGRVICWLPDARQDDSWLQKVERQLYDRMTEVCVSHQPDKRFWGAATPESMRNILVQRDGIDALLAYNEQAGLALTDAECRYLCDFFCDLGRDPTDVEIMMFAQVNSEHCRHKRFNARWVIDGVAQEKSLFDHIRHTHACHPEPVLLAYSDNAAVLRGLGQCMWAPSPSSHVYETIAKPSHAVLKVETHNHPTAVAPYPGAATGAGGEIRDEAATGCGSATRAGLCGYAVSDLHIPALPQPWECEMQQPPHLASALAIMCDAPVGAAHYQNEFGRPCLVGFFRTLTVLQHQDSQQVTMRGFHKPMMVAGGVGVVCDDQWQKKPLPHGALLLVLGGPAMRIGVGGGGASSRQLGAQSAALDFAAVQRGYPEMQRRCQEVINQCVALAKDNPILSIHDVGAGGLSNALPELVEHAGGGCFQLRAIPNAEPHMSPMGIWCNEAQERYVLAVLPEQKATIAAITARERCPWAVVGEVTPSAQLQLWDQKAKQYAVDMPMSLLFADMPRMVCNVETLGQTLTDVSVAHIDLAEAIKRVLHCPSVASKAFLIHIADRSVTGLVARDQLVGPWQMPVADVGVVADHHNDLTGVAMAMGERSPLALVDAAAAARMAIGEAITNLVAADVANCQQITLSANWMAACGVDGVDAELYEAVRSVGEDFCPALGVCIPVGKDSLSMQATWQQRAVTYDVAAPTSLVATAYATVEDITYTWTPQLQPCMDSMLLLIDLSADQISMGGSALAQVFDLKHGAGVDVPEASRLVNFVSAMAKLRKNKWVLAYHDRADGGLFATLVEMAFAGRIGMDILLPEDLMPMVALFHESLGAVIQINGAQYAAVMAIFKSFELDQHVHHIAQLNDCDQVRIYQNKQCLYTQPRPTLLGWWWATSHAIQSLRDDHACADQELAHVTTVGHDPGIHVRCAFDYPRQPRCTVDRVNAPKVAILREQGSNGHVEMAAAFALVGCVAVDVSMTDLLTERVCLSDFQIMAVCGGFSFGDVLGAGRGWALSILGNLSLRAQFQSFFHRTDTLTLGVCNGCQMLSHLRALIPGTTHWPSWQKNESCQFESRLVSLKILSNNSVWWQGMTGACLPIVAAHGQGRVMMPQHRHGYQHVVAAYADHHGSMTDHYPCNPNGSWGGVAACCSLDGRVTIMMPHPERMVHAWQWSWSPWQDQATLSPWVRLFKNAHDAVVQVGHRRALVEA